LLKYDKTTVVPVRDTLYHILQVLNNIMTIVAYKSNAIMFTTNPQKAKKLRSLNTSNVNK